MIDVRFREYLKKELKRRKTNATEAAAAMGISTATLTNIINGKTEEPTINFFRRLARWTGKPAFELMQMAFPDDETLSGVQISVERPVRNGKAALPAPKLDPFRQSIADAFAALSEGDQKVILAAMERLKKR